MTNIISCNMSSTKIGTIFLRKDIAHRSVIMRIDISEGDIEIFLPKEAALDLAKTLLRYVDGMEPIHE